jgi:hypothetical protein
LIQISDLFHPSEAAPFHLFSLCLVLLGAIIVLGWPDIEFALALETSPLAWFQSALLVACATLAALIASLSRLRGWGILALGLLGAALDERFMGHERAQEFIRYEWLRENPYAFEWTHVLTLLYIPLGVVALLWLRKNLAGTAWRWFLTGLVLGCLALGMDALFDAVEPQVYEEILEYLAEACFLCGLFNEARTRASPPR